MAGLLTDSIGERAGLSAGDTPRSNPDKSNGRLQQLPIYPAFCISDAFSTNSTFTAS
jgi:hypothetical protein